MSAEDDIDWEHLESIKDFDVCDGTTMTKLMRNIHADHQLNATQLIDNAKLFDDGVFAVPLATKASAPLSLLVESLVQQLCQLMDPTRADQLYINICAQLHRMNLIDETYRMNEFDLMRSQYQHALYQLATVARGQTDLPVALQSVWPIADTAEKSWSRYHREFEEVNFIAGGGFGQVFRARHRLDGVDYAVKKITIKYTTINRVLSHLAEVKTFASLNHTNIVPYKAAWLEPLFNNPGDRRATTARNHTRSQLSSFRDESSLDEEDDDGSDDDDDLDDSLFDRHSARMFEDDDSSSSDFIEFERSERQCVPQELPIASSPPADLSNAICEYNNNDNKKNGMANDRLPIDLTSSNSNVMQSQVDFNETQPHLKLKWATLYIQMALRPLTLRGWLDERNKCTDDFDRFYKDFLRKFVQAECVDVHNTDDEQHNMVRHSSGNRASLSLLAFEECMCRDWHNDEVAMDIFMQLLQGLNYIHLQNIVHHDIKPSNVFIGWERNGKLYVQLGDFGLACPLQANHSRDGIVGTPAYAAPEQLMGQCNPKSDLYSLGIILLELLIPFKTDMERVKTIENARRGILPSDMPVRYLKLLKRLLQPHKKRPDTVQLQQYIKKFMPCNLPMASASSIDSDDTSDNSDGGDNEYEASEAAVRADALQAGKKQMSKRTESPHIQAIEGDGGGPRAPRTTLAPSMVHNHYQHRSRKSSSSSMAADRLFIAQCLSENDSFNDSQPDVSSSSHTDVSFNDSNRGNHVMKKHKHVGAGERRRARSPAKMQMHARDHSNSPANAVDVDGHGGDVGESLVTVAACQTTTIQITRADEISERDRTIAILQRELSMTRQRELTKEREIQRLKKMLELRDSESIEDNDCL